MDFRDIASFVLSKSSPAEIEAAFRATVSESSAFSGRDPMILISESTNASMAIRVFAEGVPRTPLTAADGSIHNVVTQSDLLREFLKRSKSNSEVEAAISERIGGLGISNTNFISVTDTTPAVECFRHLKFMTSVPVVDAAGTLIAYVDASCLRSFGTAHLSELSKPILQYLQQYQPQVRTLECCSKKLPNKIQTGALSMHSEGIIHVWRMC